MIRFKWLSLSYRLILPSPLPPDESRDERPRIKHQFLRHEPNQFSEIRTLSRHRILPSWVLANQNMELEDMTPSNFQPASRNN